MSGKIEKEFQKEINRRYDPPKQKRKFLITILLSCIAFLGLLYLMSYCSAIFFKNRSTNSPVSTKTNLKPVALPATGVMKKYSPKANERLGIIRLFLRTPLEKENSSLSKSCFNGETSNSFPNNLNYYIQILDWKSSKVITTALIRNGDMVTVQVPLGVYKIRYTVGVEWYGEKYLFGSNEMFEMTDGMSLESAKIGLSNLKNGSDIGFNCINGNLGNKKVLQDF